MSLLTGKCPHPLFPVVWLTWYTVILYFELCRNWFFFWLLRSTRLTFQWSQLLVWLESSSTPSPTVLWQLAVTISLHTPRATITQCPRMVTHTNRPVACIKCSCKGMMPPIPPSQERRYHMALPECTKWCNWGRGRRHDSVEGVQGLMLKAEGCFCLFWHSFTAND